MADRSAAYEQVVRDLAASDPVMSVYAGGMHELVCPLCPPGGPTQWDDWDEDGNLVGGYVHLDGCIWLRARGLSAPSEVRDV